MFKSIKYDEDNPMMILDTDGAHVSLSQAGAVLRSLKQRFDEPDGYRKFSPSGVMFLWDGYKWEELPRFITFIEGDQR
jgi:hypothetical protein